MASFIFIPNPAAMAEIARTSEMGVALSLKAAEIAVRARAIAPVDTGEFRASITSKLDHGEAGLEGIVETDDPIWMWLEYGTSDTPTFATLRRALESGHV